jgi:predicted acetyltransferase
MIPELRRATPDDLPAIARVDGRGFGYQHTAADLEEARSVFEPDLFVLACDPADKAVIGVAGGYSLTVTMPGGAILPVPGVTWVSVNPTHRRRGVLKAMMAEQHRGFAADGAALSLLTASEGGIYRRFGYGQAGRQRVVEINRRAVTFRAEVPEMSGVRFVEPDEARKLAPEVHRRWCALTPGAVSRSEQWWDNVIRDPENRRDGASALFHVVHPDGYASYRRNRDTCDVVDFFAVTEEAHAALWQLVLGLDLVKTVTTYACPLDDPLPFLLTDPRQVKTTALKDGLWARILDVPAALAARRYAVDVDIVLDVADPFLGRGGRFRLRGGPDDAACEPADRTADVRLDIAELGALLFGGHRARTMARAGQLEVDDAAVLRLVDAAFTADREPQHGTGF